MPTESLGYDMVQRSSKIWWTIYILDREMTSLMGLPQSINDRYVQTQLPTFTDPSETMSLGMHIKLSQIIAEVNSSKFQRPESLMTAIHTVSSNICDQRTHQPNFSATHQNSIGEYSRACGRASRVLSALFGPSQRCFSNIGILASSIPSGRCFELKGKAFANQYVVYNSSHPTSSILLS